MRLIDADALMESLTIDPIGCMRCPEPEWLEELSDILDTAPTIETQVVHCRDCKYASRCISEVVFSSHRGGNTYFRTVDWCSLGEREQ